MKNNIECYIIKDLLPSYTEELVTAETKKFIEEHLNCCKSCKSAYDIATKNNHLANQKEFQEDQLEYDYLKKYRSKLSWLKITLICFISIILLAIIVFSSFYFYNKSILYRVYNNYEKIKSLNNYSILKQEIYMDYATQEQDSYFLKYDFKDGQYKREFGNLEITNNLNFDLPNYRQIDIKDNHTISYLDINKEQIITVYENEKTFTKTKLNFHNNPDNLFNIPSDVQDFNMLIYPLIVGIKNQKYNGQECYVIEYKFNNNEYKQLWVDKDNLIIIRTVEKSTNYYREAIYDILLDTVTKNDLVIPNLENYKEF